MNRYSNKIFNVVLISAAVVVSCSSSFAQAEGGDGEITPQTPKLESLLAAELEGAEGKEVIVSRVTIPPNSALPRHWHPGEEFAYVLEGEVILWQDGEPEIIAKAGEVAKVPFKKIHTAITREQGATVLVFRVHESGQPERHLVE